MKYLKIKNDKMLLNEKYNKFKRIYQNQLLTLKEFYNLKQKFYNLSMDDAFLIEISKNDVVDYYKNGERYKWDDVPLPF